MFSLLLVFGEAEAQDPVVRHHDKSTSGWGDGEINHIVHLSLWDTQRMKRGS